MPKIVNNYEIKSRIESFHNNINGFLKNDNLIIEFLSYIIFLYNKSGYGKYIWEDGEYYIGEWKNNKWDGKGIYYYASGDVYNGENIDTKRMGFGKYIWKDGESYVGEWKNNLKHGKGIDYDKNGKIIYEGDYVNDQYEGYGKLIEENGDYYIGQFLNDFKHGKGIEYYKNGKIKK